MSTISFTNKNYYQKINCLHNFSNFSAAFFIVNEKKKNRHVLKSHEPVYQAIWVDNIDFDEVLISPAMIQDHMPDTVLAALNKVSGNHFLLLLLCIELNNHIRIKQKYLNSY